MALHTIVIEAPDGVPADVIEEQVTHAVEQGRYSPMMAAAMAAAPLRVIEYHYEKITADPDPLDPGETH